MKAWLKRGRKLVSCKSASYSVNLKRTRHSKARNGESGAADILRSAAAYRGSAIGWLWQ